MLGDRAILERTSADDFARDVEIMGFKASLADRVLDQIRHVRHHVGSMHTQLRRRTGSARQWLVLYSASAAQRPKTFLARTTKRWREWLAEHHDSESEVWLIFHKWHTPSRRGTVAAVGFPLAVSAVSSCVPV